MKTLLDANAILRFLLNDNQEMAEKTKVTINQGAFTKEVVIAEVIYVLLGVYKLDRKTVANTILELITVIEIENPEVITEAMNTFKTYTLDFVDCLLIAYHNLLHIDVLSFDKKLNSKLN